jgi:nucleolar protein 9
LYIFSCFSLSSLVTLQLILKLPSLTFERLPLAATAMPKDFKKRGDRRRPKKNQEPEPEPIVDAVLLDADPSSDVFTSNADYVSLSSDPVPATRGTSAGPSTHPDRLRRSGKQVGGTQREGSEAGDEDGRREFVPGPTAVQTEIDLNAPFGFVDPDIKAYFKSVDEKLVEFSSLRPAGSSSSTGTPEDGSELEDRTNFLHSALNEVRGMELQLATDGDTALVLERLIHSMGDWGRRVLMDSFGGRWATLIAHRFGSHVCQTLIGLAAGTIHRESQGIWPVQHLEQSARIASASSSTPTSTSPPAEGHLRTASHLLLSLIDEILPLIPTLLTSPFASPPIRLLLIVLTPNTPIPSSSGTGMEESSTRVDNKIRSAKSQKFRKNHAGKGGMRSILHNNDDDEREEGQAIVRRQEHGERAERVVPPELKRMRTRIREFLAQRLKGPEWRAMGVENAGGPVIQVSNPSGSHSGCVGAIVGSSSAR